MLETNLEKVRLLLQSDISTKEIANVSGLAHDTVSNLRQNVMSIEDASFRTQVKLTDAYNIIVDGQEIIEIPKKRRLAIADAAIGINKIDGIALSEEYIDKFYKLAEGKISETEFADYVLKD